MPFGVAATQRETARAADEASQIVSFALHHVPQPSPKDLHHSELSVGQALALLSLKGDGARKQNDDHVARLFAANLIDLCWAKRIQLQATSKNIFALKVVSTQPVDVASTNAVLRHMKAIQDSRAQKKLPPIGLTEFIQFHIDRTKCHYPLFPIQDLAWKDLVQREIVDPVQKKGTLLRGPTTIYQIKNANPKDSLFKDLQGILRREQHATPLLEILLKLLLFKRSKTDPFSSLDDDEAAGEVLKAFQNNLHYTLLDEKGNSADSG